MKEQFNQVKEFNKAIGTPINDKFDFITMGNELLAQSLIEEELDEWAQAQNDKDKTEVLDAIVDLLYVVLALPVRHGISWELLKEAFDEVHRSNMAKLDGPKRADGKQLKPEGWEPPQLKKIIDKYAK